MNWPTWVWPGCTSPKTTAAWAWGRSKAWWSWKSSAAASCWSRWRQTLIAGGILSGYAPDAVKSDWLPKIASGEALVVLAQQERKARYRLDVCETKAAESRRRLDRHAVPRASCRPATRPTPSWCRPPSTARSRCSWWNAGPTACPHAGYGTQEGGRAAEVTFEAAPALLVTLDGLAALEHAVDIGIAASCAEAVGVLDKTMAVTVEYMNTRKQFGVALATFQALRHRMADMKMQLELARSMSYYASLKLNAPAEERRRAMARAKYQLGVSMRFIGQNSVQLHGGIGVTDEYIGSHYFKKLTQLELSFGDTLHHLGEVSARMQDTAGVFA